jgi:hypothetical protein
VNTRRLPLTSARAPSARPPRKRRPPPAEAATGTAALLRWRFDGAAARVDGFDFVVLCGRCLGTCCGATLRAGDAGSVLAGLLVDDGVVAETWGG